MTSPVSRYMRPSEAWKALGVEFEDVVNRLKKFPLEKRVEASKLELDKAAAICRMLKIRSHPDSHGDPEEFKKLSHAFSSLEFHHGEFERKMAKVLDWRAQQLFKTPRIVISNDYGKK